WDESESAEEDGAQVFCVVTGCRALPFALTERRQSGFAERGVKCWTCGLRRDIQVFAVWAGGSENKAERVIGILDILPRAPSLFWKSLRSCMVSQAAAELQQYCMQNACKDALLVGVPAGSNPFREPRSCALF
ncbi:guanine nucleotide-binding protein G(I)/G(S)/G(O) subunit gamma-10, partial [Ailuropoda melanoleuca]